MTPKEKEIAGEMVSLLENIKEHTDSVNTRRRIPQLELELIVSKIKKLYDKAVVLKFLHSHIDQMVSGHTFEEIPDKTQPDEKLPIEEKNETPRAEEEIKDKASDVSLHDKFNGTSDKKTVVDRLQRQAIDNLKSAIGLNERFLFINELFGGNKEEYLKHVETIDDFTSFEEAKKYSLSLSEQYHWELENASVKSFFELIERKFIK